MWDALDKIRASAGYAADPDCPSGAFTANEYANRYGISLGCAQHQIRRLVASGAMMHSTRAGVDARGRTCVLNVYWPKG